HHRTELYPAQPPPREDPQVRPHAPGRLPGAGRPVQERADRVRPLQHALPPQRGAQAGRGEAPRGVAGAGEVVDLGVITPAIKNRTKPAGESSSPRGGPRGLEDSPAGLLTSPTAPRPN